MTGRQTRRVVKHARKFATRMLAVPSGELLQMYTRATRKRRNEAGAWLRGLREQRGLTQRELAAKVDDYYTFISQLETGRTRVPPDRYLEWARALKIEPQEFVRRLMSYYDPVTYGILFGTASDRRFLPRSGD